MSGVKKNFFYICFLTNSLIFTPVRALACVASVSCRPFCPSFSPIQINTICQEGLDDFAKHLLSPNSIVQMLFMITFHTNVLLHIIIKRELKFYKGQCHFAMIMLKHVCANFLMPDFRNRNDCDHVSNSKSFFVLLGCRGVWDLHTLQFLGILHQPCIVVQNKLIAFCCSWVSRKAFYLSLHILLSCTATATWLVHEATQDSNFSIKLT